MSGAVIGPGGKVIQDSQKTTGTTITITETDNKGVVDIFGLDKEAMDAASPQREASAPRLLPQLLHRSRWYSQNGVFCRPGSQSILQGVFPPCRHLLKTSIKQRKESFATTKLSLHMCLKSPGCRRSFQIQKHSVSGCYSNGLARDFHPSS